MNKQSSLTWFETPWRSSDVTLITLEMFKCTFIMYYRVWWLYYGWKALRWLHYTDVIMGAIASQITSLTIVYSTVYSDADQRKHQSSASLAFVWGTTGPVAGDLRPHDTHVTSLQWISSLRRQFIWPCLCWKIGIFLDFPKNVTWGPIKWYVTLFVICKWFLPICWKIEISDTFRRMSIGALLRLGQK